MGLLFLTVSNSCEKEVNGIMEPTNSKIWINGVISTNDTVRIYIGTTSGMNSGDFAKYRDDATILLQLNGFAEKELEFKRESASKGYYFADRLQNTKPGDTLKFRAFILNDTFIEVSGKTYIPSPVHLRSEMNAFKYKEKIKVDLSLLFDENILKKDKFFELKLLNYKYSSIDKSDPSEIEAISILNELEYPYGFTWNEKLKSFLIDQSKLNSVDISKLSFVIKDESFGNDLVVKLSTITKDYYQYTKALDNGSVSKGNILNGVGIFSGYSTAYNKISIK